MPEKKSDLQVVKKYQREIAIIGNSLALLGWDQQTYMPKAGVSSRAEQSAFLSQLAHEKLISSELFSVLRRLREKKLSGEDKLMTDKLYSDVLKARKIPKELVSELSRATALGHDAWQRARDKKNFAIFRPFLEKIVSLKRKEAKCIGLPGSLYNGLLDGFEEGMTAEKLKPAFEKLKKELLELLAKIENSDAYKKQKTVLLNKNFSNDFQEKAVRDVAKRIGLKRENSRIDFSEHPFTTKIGVDDVRITFNVRKNPLFSFESGVHEAGHALYELNMPKEHFYDVLGGSPSLGIHESQSRFWENMVGKSRDFWKFYYPKFAKEGKLMPEDFERFYNEINKVSKGMIRVESDEVHYCLHVILRFEIETGLIEGKIKVNDLPKIWNSKMKEFFGKVPKDDVGGVLQDVHWSGGYFGYFPTYALGTIYAAQLYYALRKKHRKLNVDVRKGKFDKIGKWLKDNIHKHGSKRLAEDIVKKACGEGLNPEVYIRYLKDKYSEIYGFSKI